MHKDKKLTAEAQRRREKRKIPVIDICQEIRGLKCLGRRCAYCGRCADLCPEKSITMSKEFENATNRINDIEQKLELFMSTCQRCGRCFKEPSPLEQLKLKGYRFDDLKNDRWIFKSQKLSRVPRPSSCSPSAPAPAGAACGTTRTP